MIVKVVVGNNVDRHAVMVDDTTPIKTVLEDNGIDYIGRQMQMDFATLRPEDFNKTFADFGVNGTVYLLAVQKADNA